jgi:hypothetical protein
MDLREITAQVEHVSRQYAERFGIARTSDWHILKLHEEVGELTQAHLMRQGQARSKGMTDTELDARFAAEIADDPVSRPLISGNVTIRLIMPRGCVGGRAPVRDHSQMRGTHRSNLVANRRAFELVAGAGSGELAGDGAAV